MNEALISHGGQMGTLLDCVVAQAGEFARAEALVPGAGRMHLEAILWAGDAADGLLGGYEPLAA